MMTTQVSRGDTPYLSPATVVEQESAIAPADSSALRARAFEAHLKAEPTSTALSELWTDLVARRVVVVDHFCRHRRCWMIVREREAEAELKWPSERSLRIFTQIVLGEAQKVVCIEQSLPASTVAVAARRCAHAMGIEASATRLPIVLIAAAHAHHGRASVLAHRAPFSVGARQYRVLSIEDPSSLQALALTSAERSIVALLVARQTNAEIARVRGTSIRTIANQMSMLLRKFGARGRLQLMGRLVSVHDVRVVLDPLSRTS